MHCFTRRLVMQTAIHRLYVSLHTQWAAPALAVVVLAWVPIQEVFTGENTSSGISLGAAFLTAAAAAPASITTNFYGCNGAAIRTCGCAILFKVGCNFATTVTTCSGLRHSAVPTELLGQMWGNAPLLRDFRALDKRWEWITATIRGVCLRDLNGVVGQEIMQNVQPHITIQTVPVVPLTVEAEYLLKNDMHKCKVAQMLH